MDMSAFNKYCSCLKLFTYKFSSFFSNNAEHQIHFESWNPASCPNACKERKVLHMMYINCRKRGWMAMLVSRKTRLADNGLDNYGILGDIVSESPWSEVWLVLSGRRYINRKRMTSKTVPVLYGRGAMLEKWIDLPRYHSLFGFQGSMRYFSSYLLRLWLKSPELSLLLVCASHKLEFQALKISCFFL